MHGVLFASCRCCLSRVPFMAKCAHTECACSSFHWNPPQTPQPPLYNRGKQQEEKVACSQTSDLAVRPHDCESPVTNIPQHKIPSPFKAQCHGDVYLARFRVVTSRFILKKKRTVHPRLGAAVSTGRSGSHIRLRHLEDGQIRSVLLLRDTIFQLQLSNFKSKEITSGTRRYIPIPNENIC